MHILVHRDESGTIITTYYHLDIGKVTAKLNQLALDYESSVDQKVEWDDDKLGWISLDDDTKARIYIGVELL